MGLAIISGLAVLIAIILPLRWGVFGFLGATALLFSALFGFLSLRGFEGLPLEESLLLFEGSMAAYLGFNAQVAYRAFAIPALILAAMFIFRQQRALRMALPDS